MHESVADTVDSLLRGHQPNPQVRTVNDSAQVTMEREFPNISKSCADGQVLPFPKNHEHPRVLGQGSFDSLLSQSEQYLEQFGNVGNQHLGNGKELPLHIYSYGISHPEFYPEISRNAYLI